MKESNKTIDRHCTKSTFYAMFGERGITLIALIITIVVLLVLAGITVANITGGDSVIDKAGQAKNETALSAKVEEVNNAIAMSMSSAFDQDLDMTKLQTNLGKLSGVTLSTSTFPAKVEILDEPYIIYSDGELFKGSNGNARVPIPYGFVASQATGENDVTTGLVIYEGSEPVTDSNVATARTTRNQFVWVPVGGNIKYEKNTSYNSVTYLGYAWKDDDAISNINSVTKYGGFYVGRYEAGWAQKENGDTYESNKHDTTKNPVTRKGYSVWNCIDQVEAKTVCENLYKNSESVKSQLIDSYAWDATSKWLNNSEKCKAYNKITNSTNYGNYRNNNSTISANTLYAIPLYTNTSKWLTPNAYRKNSTTNVDLSFRNKSIEESNLANYTNDTPSGTNFATRIELSSGASEDYNLNNVYDMAGNLWEWTTEIGDLNATTVTHGYNAVRRGGSFYHPGNDFPIVMRNGDGSTSNYSYVNVGFRPVLYLK